MFSAALVLLSCIAAAAAQTCKEPDAFYADPNQCDAYVQCIDGVPHERLCYDGLVFDEKLENVHFPCSYQIEVDCTSRPKLQPAQPTQNCDRAWGYYGSKDSSICDVFWNCVDGQEFQFACPEGLAFSPLSYACDWPINSPSCNVEEYLGFACPTVRDESQISTIGFLRYASPRDCRQYFLCIGIEPRLQTCEAGTVYNSEVDKCDEPEHVQGCQSYYPPEELAAIRERREKALLAQEKRLREYRERIERLN